MSMNAFVSNTKGLSLIFFSFLLKLDPEFEVNPCDLINHKKNLNQGLTCTQGKLKY